MAEMQRGHTFLAGLISIRYFPREAAKVMPEASPLPGLLASPTRAQV